MTTPAVEAEALKLPPRKRVASAEKLIASVDSFADKEIEGVWKEEIQRRREEIHSGTEQGIPADDVLAEARRAIDEARGVSSAGGKRTGKRF